MLKAENQGQIIIRWEWVIIRKEATKALSHEASQMFSDNPEIDIGFGEKTVILSYENTSGNS